MQGFAPAGDQPGRGLFCRPMQADTQQPEVSPIDLSTLDADSLMQLTPEQLASLPDDVRGQVEELRDQVKQAAEQAEQDRQRRVQGLGQHVLTTYHERVALRAHIEERWHKDIRRFNGEYEPDVQRALESRVFGSRVFVPLARRVINIVYARLVDLIFPTEERSFVIKHSPIPELVRAETLAKRMAPDATVSLPGGRSVTANAVSQSIRELREEAAQKAEGMQREIDDQLQQANWGRVGRDALREGVILGSGVVKGPIVLNRRKKVWDITTGRVRLMEDLSPTATSPSVWDFFPDMSARKIDKSVSEIERHYVTTAELARYATQPGFDADAIRKVLATKPAHRPDPVRDQLRAANGLSGIVDPRYLMLEYHGPVDAELLVDMGLTLPDDPLMVYEAVLFVMEDGTVVKAVINPMDTQERPYSVWCWEEDPACIFGTGLSYESADMVEACNSSFRAAMDNLGLSVGPQVVVNDRLIEPENGRWVIEPNKVWRAKKADADVRAAFGFFQIDSKLSKLLGVFDRSKAMLDDIAGPAMAMQGQDAPSYLDTARGASLAWNASNIWMRRGVRNWDDDVTAPMVGRFIDWNMQYSEKPDIKGDLLAQARGFSGLLEAEGQAQKVGIFMKSIEGMPMPFKRRVAQARAQARALRLDADDLLPDEAEVEKIASQIDNQGPPPNPEVLRIELRRAEIEDNKAQRQHELAIDNGRNNIRLAEIASREQLTMDQARQKYGIEQLKLTTQLQDKREQRQADAQALNAELTTKAVMGSGV